MQIQTKNLDLFADSGFKTHCRFIWNGFLLSENSQIEKSLDLSDFSFEEALSIAKPSIHFLEVVAIHRKIKNLFVFNSEDLFRKFGFSLDNKLELLIAKIDELPESFFKWSFSHALSQRDLMPLLSVHQLSDLSEIFTHLSRMNPSRSYGAQIIELSIENFLLGQEIASLSPKSDWTAEEWLESLKKARFPQTFQRDQKREEQLKTLPWSKDLNPRWCRQGDRSGLEVRFLISSKKDLQDKMQNLQRVDEAFRD